MTMLPHEGRATTAAVDGGFERVLRALSVVTMAMTVPQVIAVWSAGGTAGVSLASWTTYLGSACLWFVYGLRKRDPTIYVACIGWILLDVAIVAGIVLNR